MPSCIFSCCQCLPVMFLFFFTGSESSAVSGCFPEDGQRLSLTVWWGPMPKTWWIWDGSCMGIGIIRSVTSQIISHLNLASLRTSGDQRLLGLSDFSLPVSGFKCHRREFEWVHLHPILHGGRSFRKAGLRQLGYNEVQYIGVWSSPIDRGEYTRCKESQMTVEWPYSIYHVSTMVHMWLLIMATEA